MKRGRRLLCFKEGLLPNFSLFFVFTHLKIFKLTFVLLSFLWLKLILPVSQKPWYDPNREFCDPLHPYWVSNDTKLNANGWSVPLITCCHKLYTLYCKYIRHTIDSICCRMSFSIIVYGASGIVFPSPWPPFYNNLKSWII